MNPTPSQPERPGPQGLDRALIIQEIQRQKLAAGDRRLEVSEEEITAFVADKDAEIISSLTRLHELLSTDEDMQSLRCAKVLGFIPANPIGAIHGEEVPGVQKQEGPGCVQESKSEEEKRHSSSGVEKSEPRDSEGDLAALYSESSRPLPEQPRERGQGKEDVSDHYPQRDLLRSIGEAEYLSGLQEIERQNPGTPQRLLETIRRGLAMCSLPHSEAPKIFRGLIGIEGLCCEIARLREERDQWKLRHGVACDTITGLQNERTQRQSWQILAGLSSFLGMGEGDGTLESLDKGIREGIALIVGVETERREKAESDLTTARATIAEREKRIAELVGALEKIVTAHKSWFEESAERLELCEDTRIWNDLCDIADKAEELYKQALANAAEGKEQA